MQLVRGLHNVKSQFINGCVATIGNYDGVHLGHQEILNLVKKKSEELKLPSVVVIFEPQPEEFFTGGKSQRLSSLREKILLLRQQGVDKILLLPFNAHFTTITASQFIAEILVKVLHIRHLVIGDDFVFGHKRAGGFSLLQQEAVSGGFQVTMVDSFKIDGVRISSSLIRIALLQGNLDIATKFLGRPYRVSGIVVHGDQLGRNLGFPTANICLKWRELPLAGVYTVKVYDLTPIPLLGISNIGFRPTVSSRQRLFEVYILDFSSDIYGKRATVEFCKRVRDEQKFSSLAELQLQIKKDVVVARELFKTEIMD